MKHGLLRLLFGIIIFLVGRAEMCACHGVALVGFSAVTNASSVVINGSSNSATCGCGPYYMEVELACFSASNFTGLAPACNAATWNTYPWFRSLLNVPNYNAASGWPDNCVIEPYTTLTIPFTVLCAGTQYVLRARERVCGSTSAGPWSTNFTFTTPGTPPNFILSANANPTSVCVGTPSTLTAVLTGVGGCGNGTPIFTWMPGNIIGQTVSVTPSVTTIYTVTVSGGYVACYPVPPSTCTVTVIPPPTAGVASVSPPVVCQGGCVTLTLTGSVGNVQWQSSPNGIVWTNIAGATTTPYVYCPVMAAMFFHAIVSGAPGCGSATSNTVSVGITPVPTLTINPAAPSICSGQSITLTVAGSSGYTWTGPNAYTASGASVTVSPTTTTTYTVSTSGLCPATQTVTVTVNPLPVIVFSPPNPSICAGTSITIDAGSDLNNYVWTPTAGLTFLSPSNDSVLAAPTATTNYNVTATTSAGCVSSGSVIVNVNPLPVLLLSDTSIVICPNMTDTVTISGANAYVWNPLVGATLLNPNGSQVEFNPIVSGTYSVVGTSSAGCIDSATVSVTVSNNIIVDAGLPDSICPGVSTQLVASGGNNYSWSSNNAAVIVNGNTANPTVTPSVTTIFTVNVTNTFGCTGFDSVTVLVYNLPTPNAGLDTNLCIGASIDLSGSGGLTYSWSGPNITNGSNSAIPTVAPVASSVYEMTVTDINGCQNSDSVNVTVHLLPNANAGADQTVCGTNCASLLASGGNQYVWSPITFLSSPLTPSTQSCPPNSITYVVTVTDIYGCVNSDSVKVIVAPPINVLASNDDSICPGNSTIVSANASGGIGGPYIYSWSPVIGLVNPNAQTTNASPSSTTTYTIMITDACGSIAVIDSVTILVFPSPQLTLTPSITEGCAPVCVDFTGQSIPAMATCTYEFGDLATSANCNPSHCYFAAGSYSVVYAVIDVNGCPSTITYPNMITVHPNPIAGFGVAPQITSILTPTIVITPNCTSCDTTTYAMGDYAGSSITNNGLPFSFVYGDTGTFAVTQYAINQFGCTDSITEFVVIEPDWSFFAPNAFTPNDDGHNDEFFVYGEGIDNTTFQLFIFDRWGNIIFSSNDINKGWNGHANQGAQLAQIDTYVWSAKFRDIKGDSHKFVGHLSLIR